MKRPTRLHLISRTPLVAQSTIEIKLTGTTEMIDQILLGYRQQPWKATGPSGGTDTTTDTTIDTTTETEI